LSFNAGIVHLQFAMCIISLRLDIHLMQIVKQWFKFRQFFWVVVFHCATKWFYESICTLEMQYNSKNASWCKLTISILLITHQNVIKDATIKP